MLFALAGVWVAYSHTWMETPYTSLQNQLEEGDPRGIERQGQEGSSKAQDSQ
jgi:hypothetical protein